jgi:ParB/RepB/Spo0J family partition protein
MSDELGSATELGRVVNEARARQWVGRVVEVPIPMVRIEGQQRRTFREEALQTLMRSISTVGLSEPVQVYAGPLDENGNPRYYRLCAGERRLRACEALGLSAIKVIVVGLEADLVTPAGRAQFNRRQYAENATHEHLNLVEDAGALQQLMADLEASEPSITKGAVVQRICTEWGISKTELYDRLRLLDLSARLQEAVVRSDISRARLYGLLKAWAERCRDGWPRETAELGRKALDRMTRRAGWPKPDLYRLDRLRVIETWKDFEQHLAGHCEESLVRRDSVMRSIAAHVDSVERTEDWFLSELAKTSRPAEGRKATKQGAKATGESRVAEEMPAAGEDASSVDPSSASDVPAPTRTPVAARTKRGGRLVVRTELIGDATRDELAEAEAQVVEVLQMVQAAMRAAS